jgi:hypothetical protein
MVVCPLCEHTQEDGAECQVCGRRLPEAPELAAPVPTMPELEPTLAPPAADLPADRMADLEVTSHEPVGASDAALIPDLEPSAAAPVDVDSALIPDLDTGLEGLPADEPTPYPAVVVCRYCRTEAQLGERICARCGMRLPTIALVPPLVEEEAAPTLCSCGAPVRGAKCPSCGARNPSP